MLGLEILDQTIQHGATYPEGRNDSGDTRDLLFMDRRSNLASVNRTPRGAFSREPSNPVFVSRISFKLIFAKMAALSEDGGTAFGRDP